VNTPKEALIISAVGLATTAFTGYSILRALKARRWQPTSGTVLESDIESPCAMPRGSSNSILEIQNEDWHRNHEGRGGKKNNQSMPQRVRG